MKQFNNSTINLSIIIVSYNTKDILKECLESIQNNVSDKIDYEVIVVDNASSDGSVESIKSSKSIKGIKSILFIENKENVGFARANNIGIKQSKGKYVLFLNSDTVVYKNTFETMVKFMDEYHDTGAATCRVELVNGELDDSCHRGFPTPWRSLCHFTGLSRIFSKSRIFAGYSLGYLNLNTVHEIDACSGAFMMTRRSAGDEVEWWDEDFFWYGEDLDFCFRLKDKNWKIYFVPTVKILHYKGVSGGIKKISKHLTSASSETKIRATNARFDAMKIFYKKHYINKYPNFVTWLVLKGVDVRHWLTRRSL